MQNGTQKSNTVLRFVVISDPHVGAPGTPFKEAVSLCNSLDIEFVMLIGDLVHDMPTAENVRDLLDQLKHLCKPMYLALGNCEGHVDGTPYSPDVEKELRAFPGPWSESFTYSFDRLGWRFVVLGAVSRLPTTLKNYYAYGHKGLINRAGEILYVPEKDLQRFATLLDESRDRPTCVVSHVPFVPTAKRVMESGETDQTRVIQELQLRDMVRSYPNVRAAFYGHQHFNQVDVINGQLHCITQNLATKAGAGIRLMELSRIQIRGTLIWTRDDGAQPSSPGTLAADRSFSWRFSQKLK